MRRIISLALTAMILISMFTVGVFTTSASAADVGRVDAGYTPSGSPIGTADELKNATAGDYYLTADITVTETNTNTDFYGTIDGNGHTITVSVPMFENASDVTFKNMVLEGEIDYRDKNRTDWHCGAIAMEATNVTLENIASYVDIIGYETAKTIIKVDPVTLEETPSYDSIYSGGLLGSVYGDVTVKNCDNYGEISALVAGGLIGSIKKVPKAQEDPDGDYKSKVTLVVFENCNNYGLVTDEGCKDLIVQQEDGSEKRTKFGIAGGLIAYGLATDFTFTNCTNTADILSQNTGIDNGIGSSLNEDGTRNHAGEHEGSGVSGGLAGRILQSSSQYDCQVTFTNCRNDGDVIGWSQIGGIGGWINCSVAVYDSVNNGAVTSRGNYAAGIIGRPGVDYYPSDITVVFEGCVNNGTVTGHRQYAGGISSYSIDMTRVTRCLNTGTLQAEGVSATTQNPDLHTVYTGGILVNISQTADISYCISTGTQISNCRAGGILGSAGAGKISNITFEGGYNVIKGCLSTGNLYVYSKDNDKDLNNIVTTDASGKQVINYYYASNNAAGILGYSYGSGNSNSQAPRIYGCGVTGSINTDWGVACAFLGYTNTSYANVMGNYFTGELNGPDECVVPHQVQMHTNYQLEYATAWIDRCDAQQFILKNYFIDGTQNKYMLLQNNGAEIDFTGYEYIFTKADLESGKLAYELNQVVYDEFEEILFFQDLTGADGKYPNCPYLYLTMAADGKNIESIKFHVVPDGNGGYKNEVYYPDETQTAPPPETESEEEDVTTKPQDVTTADPGVTDKAPETTAASGGGCGGVVAAPVALIALALIAPAGLLLKKKDEE